ncbi:MULTISPECIES: SDR family oxidoreductase [unclassified Pseudofrankia]|uniref:SDR family NAD(P)-dependent oxidoreductase n=1 Tax=unclassified Pseudofrankia TaxID=2994372 RepID=UPI0008D99B57|nr:MULTISPECIES: SDR family NAD(P)-dependent oxidoreductase [unclassified Pseudofrankia]MDT3442259.1 SDR family NAD(P)-dependent oxidoreductase [Pseudofrankia sp. BMG5.37]OHV43534.1 short-chain dehydrogenase [Pseudofrankia sp. BMG5.36]
MDKLDGRGAVVVGGGSGIGRGIALGLAGEGMRVLVADIDAENAGAVRDEIARSGGDARAARVDATDSDSVAKLATAAADDLDRVHVFVNTVGVLTDAAVTTSSEQVWAWFVEFHLMAAVRMVEAFLPLLRAHDDGAHIVLTSSMAGMVALPAEQTGGMNTGVYTVLKHAVVGYGDMLRHDLTPEGIGVSVLCPGAVATSLVSTTARHRPERFGGPMSDPMAGRTLPPGMMPPGMMPIEALGPIVVRGIRANRPYIFTHPEMQDVVRARQQQVLDDFEFSAET